MRSLTHSELFFDRIFVFQAPLVLCITTVLLCNVTEKLYFLIGRESRVDLGVHAEGLNPPLSMDDLDFFFQVFFFTYFLIVKM